MNRCIIQMQVLQHQPVLRQRFLLPYVPLAANVRQRECACMELLEHHHTYLLEVCNAAYFRRMMLRGGIRR